jgi:hypothetical protein
MSGQTKKLEEAFINTSEEKGRNIVNEEIVRILGIYWLEE